MDYLSGGNGYIKILTIYKRYQDSNNGDVSSGNGFINRHTISQCNYSSNFKYMDGDIENGDVSGGHGYMNSHTIYKNNGFK